ncbi:hypothetical protein KY346_06790 [Candidatus Woesearchaeota archaeon]|nr:hypothetical protein [Candidatus Woesearchaeota archaeon]
MAISKQTEIDFERLIKLYLKRTPISRQRQKEGGLILDRLNRWRAMVFLLLFAIAAGITISSCYKRPKPTAKVPASIAKLLDAKEIPALPKLADEGTATNLYEILKDKDVQDALFSCAQSINSARDSMAMQHFEGAIASLDAAIKFWAELPAGKEKRAMLAEMMSVRQQIAEYQAKLKIDKAKALVEVISNYLNKYPKKRVQNTAELLIIRKYIMQLEGATSTRDPALKKEFKNLLALINTLLEKLRATR